MLSRLILFVMTFVASVFEIWDRDVLDRFRGFEFERSKDKVTMTSCVRTYIVCHCVSSCNCLINCN